MNRYVLTFDVDWVSDWAIRSVAEILEQNDVKSTWFITHDSPAIRWLIKRPDLFEVGIHPNMLAGTTQGKTEEEIFAYMKRIVPNAQVVRTHGLVFSNALMKNLILKYGIQFDSSVLLFESANIEPHLRYYKETQTPLVRLPYFWEDSIEILKPTPTFNFSNMKYHVPGLKIFDFHPVHIVLNTNDLHPYNWCKQKIGVGHIDEENTSVITNHGIGARLLLENLLKYIKHIDGRGYTLSEIAHEWLER